MSQQSEQLMRRIWQRSAIIKRHRGAQLLPIFPNGDARCRRIGWIETVDVIDWVDRGILVLRPKGYGLSDAVLHRLSRGQSPREVEEALSRPIRSPRRQSQQPTSPIDTMHRLVDRDGNPVFTRQQIEAARHYAADLRRAGQGGGRADAMSTSDPSAPVVDGTRRHDRNENAAIRRLDANRAVNRARKGLDGRVQRVLSRVIGADEPLDAVDRQQGWGTGVGAMLMQIGLDHLARHYRLGGR